MTTLCLAPTEKRPLTSVRRLALLGTLGGLAVGGGAFAVYYVVSAIVSSIVDAYGFDPGSFGWFVTSSVILSLLGAVFGAAIGVVCGVIAALVGRATRRSRIGVAAGGFATAAFLSWWPLAVLFENDPRVLVPVTLAVALFTAWVMSVDRFPPRRLRAN